MKITNNTEELIEMVRRDVRRLLYDDVIECTIGVMGALKYNLNFLLQKAKDRQLTDEQKKEITEILLPLASESIREALHKGELPITNGIIRSKNDMFRIFGVTVPEDHKEIDPKDYPNYHW